MPTARCSSTTRRRRRPVRSRAGTDSTSFAESGSLAPASATCSSHRRRPRVSRHHRRGDDGRRARVIQCGVMRHTLTSGVLLIGLAMAACGTDTREWMKLDQTYTTAEFRRDLQQCTVKGKLDDDCMKARGWVAVTPPKAEQKKEDPLSQPAGRVPRR